MANRQRKDLGFDKWEEYGRSPNRRQRIEDKASQNRYDRESARTASGRHGRGAKLSREEW